jgi:hypothetical protein
MAIDVVITMSSSPYNLHGRWILINEISNKYDKNGIVVDGYTIKCNDCPYLIFDGNGKGEIVLGNHSIDRFSWTFCNDSIFFNNKLFDYYDSVKVQFKDDKLFLSINHCNYESILLLQRVVASGDK